MIKFIEQSDMTRKLTNEGNIRSDFRTKVKDAPKNYYYSTDKLSELDLKYLCKLSGQDFNGKIYAITPNRITKNKIELVYINQFTYSDIIGKYTLDSYEPGKYFFRLK